MTQYETGMKTVISAKNDQTPAENKACKARNAASEKLANAHKAAAEKRGVENQ